MLEVDGIHVAYGEVKVLHGVSLCVNQGEIVTLLGANGAGKSTTLKTIIGLLHPWKGSIRFMGKPIHNVPTEAIISSGISMVPEGRRVFPRLTVEENLEIGGILRRDRRGLMEDMNAMFQQFPRLAERRKQLAGTLSGGEQQMLAIARALMARPRLLLADEPSMGLAPILVQEVFRVLKQLQEKGTTILVVEQNARVALSIADRGYVLQNGVISVAGTAKELAANPMVRKAYLGMPAVSA